LKAIKREQCVPARKSRRKMQIQILSEIKTNKDYFKNDVLVGNGRNFTHQYPNVCYDYEDS